YQQIQNGFSIAQEIARAGDPVEAVRIYNRLLADKESLEQANQYGGERFTEMIEGSLQRTLKMVKPGTLPAAVGGLLVPRADASAEKPALDLVVILESRDLARVTFNSVFAAAIKSTEKAPDVRKNAVEKLADLVKKYPKDYSVQTAAALTAFADGKPDGVREAV